MTETLFIINPASGGGAALRVWRRARPALVAAGVRICEHLTAAPGDAISATRNALETGISRIIAVGGDGTLSEVVNGYLDDGGQAIRADAAIGVLRAGTGSDFSRTIGAENLEASIRGAAGSAAIAVDAARISLTGRNGEYCSRWFINIATFGLGGDTAHFVGSWRADRRLKWLTGRAMYAAAALRALERYRNHAVEVRLDDEGLLQVSTNLLVVANGRYAGGGMKLAPHAQVADGAFDVILTDGISRWDIIRELPRIGRAGHLNNPKVSERRAARVSITAAEPMPVEVDGDFAGYTPACLEVLPAAVRFLTARDSSQAESPDISLD